MQGYGFSVECVSICFCRFDDIEKQRLHIEHAKGFSPEFKKDIMVSMAASNELRVDLACMNPIVQVQLVAILETLWATVTLEALLSIIVA